MQRRHLFNFQVSNWWFQLYVAYFLNPLIEDYLELFDTLRLRTVIKPFPRQEKEMEKEKGGRRIVFKSRRSVICSN